MNDGATPDRVFPSASGELNVSPAHDLFDLPDTRAWEVDRRQRNMGARRAIQSIKAEHSKTRTHLALAADRLTRVASSALFLIIHIGWFTVWIVWNSGAFGMRPFDPFPFGLLTMVVSLEAIFLSIFVLMAQGRESEIAELREEIALQVSLRTEEEVTKTLQLVAGLYSRLGQQLADDPELQEMLQPLDAENIERLLLNQIREARRLKIVRRAAAPPPG